MHILKVVGRAYEIQYHGISQEEFDQQCNWLDDWDYPLGYEHENDSLYPLLLNYYHGDFDLEFYLDNKHIFNLPAGRLMEMRDDAYQHEKYQDFPLRQFGKFVIEKQQLRIPEFTLEITEPFDFFKFRYAIELTKVGGELYSSLHMYYGDKQFILHDLGDYKSVNYGYCNVERNAWVRSFDDDEIQDLN